MESLLKEGGAAAAEAANAGGGGSRFSGLKFQQQVTATASPFDYVKAGAAVSSKANLFLYIPDNPFN